MPPIAVISIARDNVGYLFSFVSLIIYWPRIWSSKLLNERCNVFTRNFANIAHTVQSLMESLFQECN